MNKNQRISVRQVISSLFTSIFGRLNWNSPPWLKYLNHQSKHSPKAFWGTLFLFMALILAAGYTIHWYKNLPEPIYITASITVPEITPNQEELVPNPLTLDFGIQRDGFTPQSVAPINLIGKAVTEGIEISPKIAGEWRWNSDSQLVFTPSDDWMAGQKYTIHTSDQFFAANTNIKSHDFSFSSKPFVASITDFKFYQDPVNSELRKAVGTIEFNYPVSEESLKANTSLIFQAIKNGKLDINAEPIKFTYTFDANKRVAYLNSETIKIKDVARYLLLTLGKKVSASSNTAQLDTELTQNLLIPDASNFMKVLSTSASIIRNDKDRPEQVLTIETSLGVNESEFNKSVHVYLLPINYPATRTENEIQNYAWQNPGEVTSSILSLATPLTKEAIPTEQNYATLHSFKFATQTPRYIYVTVDKGMSGFGGFNLNDNYAAIFPAPEYPKEISFLHKGSLLALSGEKKLSVLIRGVPAVKFDFARVLPNNVNQLITQTQGDFNNPYFINPSFNQQNISQIFSDIQQFDNSDFSKQQYTALDLSKYLSTETNSSGPQGLFLLQATGWDVANKSPLDVKASRLILITDLGMLVKDNNDGTHDVFVDSITQGAPVTGVTVTVLGKNGLPILSRVSDSQGRVNFPSLKDFIDDREPIAYLASINNDVSFIPYNNYNRQLNFSKFDIGGIYTNPQELQSLSAYLFSDRGIYRPGDAVHIGMIVKQAYSLPAPAGLPLQATVQDARGTTIKDEKITLNETGYLDLDFATQGTSPTGQYTVNLFLVKDNHPQNLLGSTTIRVSEFLPDRMRIKSDLIPKPSDGWTSPVNLKGHVSLWNLYGAAATDRKISAKILLTPEQVKFDQYPDYIFSDPLFDPKKPPKVFSETLSDAKTNDKGEAEFSLNLEQFEKATYQLTFFAEGFEADGGRSVTTQSQTLISPLDYFIGYKPDGDLSFVKQNSVRTINYIAVSPQLTKEDVKDLKVQLVSLHPVTTLVKKADGTYQYQSIIQSSIISTTPFSINAQGTAYNIPTEQIGDYSLSILSKDNTVLSQLKFTIVGASQTPLAKNAELSIKLSKDEYKAGEAIELQITAPYTGSGLITIERDKVYATQWFKTETTNSVQTIHVPADFQGNGYINVAFIRDWDSPELFVSPLSYSVVPFTVDHEAHDINIDLKTPAVVRPGEPITIDYHSDKPGKIIVFAVDEGILQVARYETPDPLSFFFQKHALEVLTQQTVDQILPKFIQDRELSAVGGDDRSAELSKRLNPFKRKTDLPVAFWSGIIDTDSTARQLTYHIPDYFNGKLRVMAVAVSADSIGAQETSAEIRGDFIINPNVPTFVAPGDEFVISASVANNIKDSGDHAEISLNLTSSPEIEIIDSKKQILEIAEGHEKTVRFKLRAKPLLGAAKVTFTATSTNNKSTSIDATLSVRPASTYTTSISSGKSKEPKKNPDIIHSFYPEYRIANATMSPSPLILVFGLQRYLDNYPYGCTEQLTSKALPLLAMNSQPWFNKDKNTITEKVNTTIQMLSQRQMSNGGFSYWPGYGVNSGNTFASIYAMHFLTEAREQGFVVPNDLFFNGISFLKDLAGQNASDLNAARMQAYAIYILTRNELVTTNYLANLQLYLQQNNPKEWQKDIATVYIAASYQLLKSSDEANKLIGQYDPDATNNLGYDFYNGPINNAQYFYILAKHFPNLLKQVEDKLLMQLITAINNDGINTLLSAYTSLALSAYPQTENALSPSLSITEVLDSNKEKKSEPQQSNYVEVAIDNDSKALYLNNPNQLTFFYQVTQSGFEKTAPKEPIKKGIEIFREYRNEQGAVITSTSLGNEIEVHLQIRGLDSNTYLTNIAIEDLLPGGFEVVQESVKTNTMSFFDIREDRVNFFGDVDSSAKEIVYKIKAVNSGTFTVPPAYAESMYNPKIQARGVASEITVTTTP